jgi:hypothetical protein
MIVSTHYQFTNSIIVLSFKNAIKKGIKKREHKNNPDLSGLFGIFKI